MMLVLFTRTCPRRCGRFCSAQPNVSTENKVLALDYGPPNFWRATVPAYW
jgi:hypothetical protein